MSDTTGQTPDEADDDKPAPIPNYGFVRKKMSVDGMDEEWAEIRFGVNPTNPGLPAHVAEIREVDMGDQFDLAEIAGNQVENNVWLSLAIVAMAVQSLDSAPILRGSVTKAGLKQTLRKLGPLGVRAVRRGLGELSAPAGGQQTEESIKAAAGN